MMGKQTQKEVLLAVEERSGCVNDGHLGLSLCFLWMNNQIKNNSSYNLHMKWLTVITQEANIRVLLGLLECHTTH